MLYWVATAFLIGGFAKMWFDGAKAQRRYGWRFRGFTKYQDASPWGVLLWFAGLVLMVVAVLAGDA